MARRIKFSLILPAVFLAVFLSNSAYAHSGRTDSSGGHNCRTGSCAGTYHYHNGGSVPAPKSTYTPPKSTYTPPKTLTMTEKIIKEIDGVKGKYQESHEGFRERLIGQIVTSLGANEQKVARHVYGALPDITDSSQAPSFNIDSNGTYTCNCSKTCPNMSSCAEAQYQLNDCGCSARDADSDGVACDADCQ